tara:strand:+ start:197712 stop:199340 length:1629 start_codon:yes stop_codon:yes gene_type:complete
MKKAKKPKDEEQRLKELVRFEVLDTLPEQVFDDLTLLAANICNVPIALISLVDSDRQWFKSRQGLDAEETPRDLAFCAHAILEDETFIVPNSDEDERFFDNPLVTGGPNVKFYAGAPLTTDAGFNIGTLCVIDNKPGDLTAAQQDSLEALARQVVSQLNLRIANKEIVAANMAKSRFLANMSHEVRTPITAIVGFSEVLLDGKLTEDVTKNINYIKRCSTSLLRIVDDLLDFSKLEAKKLKVEVISFDIQEEVKAALAMMESLAQDKKIKLKLNFSDMVPTLAVNDPLRLTQVIYNVVGNAIKFSPNDGVVEVSVSSLKDSYIEFKVKDYGIGISNEVIPRLFQGFEQAETSTSRKFGGTGLGLAISKELAQLMGGDIEVTSELEQWTEFRFYIKNFPEKSSENKVYELTEQVKPSDLDCQKLRLLIAEDNLINQKLAQHVANSFNFKEVKVVNNGVEALAQCLDDDWDIVLMDFQMPELDGFEATKKIKEKKSNIIIIGVSANSFVEDEEKAFRCGMDDFMTKPINKTKLSKSLKKLFTKK